MKTNITAVACITIHLLIAINPCYGQSNEKVKFVNLEEGLSHSAVMSIEEDDQGYIWVGTRNGLNRYDGLNFEIYEPVFGDSTSLANPFIFKILKSRSGGIWLGTMGGLSHFIEERDHFENFEHSPDDPYSLPKSAIFSIVESSDSLLWLASNKGVHVFDPVKKQVVKRYLPDNIIQDLLIDSKGRTWAVGDRIFLLRENDTFEDVLTDSNLTNEVTNNFSFRGIAEDKYGGIWYASNFHGLLKLKKDGKTKPSFDRLQLYQEDGTTRNTNRTLCVSGDSKGNLWVGIENGGLYKYKISKGQFEHFQSDPNNPQAISGMSIWAIKEENLGKLWVGNFSNGLSVIDPYQKAFESITSKTSSNLKGKAVKSFATDSKGNVWIGMDGYGLVYYDVKKDTYTHYRHDPENLNSLSKDAVLSISIDNKDNLLIGMWGGGLNYFDTRQKRFTRFFHDPNNPSSIIRDNVYHIFQDEHRPGNFWIGTYGAGLDYFNTDTQQFEHPVFEK